MTNYILAIQKLVSMRRAILMDLYSAHSARADGASEWMREEDREMRNELKEIFDELEAHLDEV